MLRLDGCPRIRRRRELNDSRRAVGLVGRILHVVLRLRSEIRHLPLSHRLYRAHALLAQDALDPADGIAVAIEQAPNTAQKVDVLRAIIASATTALHRSDMRKTALP